MSPASEPAPSLVVIARVRSRHTETDHTPVQPALNPDDRAEVHVDEEYAGALDGIEGFEGCGCSAGCSAMGNRSVVACPSARRPT
jgi:hypothetical protein